MVIIEVTDFVNPNLNEQIHEGPDRRLKLRLVVLLLFFSDKIL